MSLSDICRTNYTINKVYVNVNEMFNLNIDEQIKQLDLRFESFHEIVDLINDIRYYSLTIDNTDLRFQDRKGLFEVLIKFFAQQIENIPKELEDLENERHNARYWDDVQHFYETEALSDKECKLTKLKNKLQKEHNKLIKNKPTNPIKKH